MRVASVSGACRALDAHKSALETTYSKTETTAVPKLMRTQSKWGKVLELS